MEKFRNKYRISSARMRTWNYGNNGSYFVTICTKYRKKFFGEIINKKMNLNDMGKIANNYWEEIPEHFKFVKLGEYVIMPNHTHGIIIIDKYDIETVETMHDSVETTHDSVETTYDSVETTHDSVETTYDSVGTTYDSVGTTYDSVGTTYDSVETTHALSLQPSSNHFRFRNQGKNTLSSIIGSYKSAVTKSIRGKCESGNLFGWQGRFHDHIIRSEKEFLRISEYIRNNPANWKEDKFYKP